MSDPLSVLRPFYVQHVEPQANGDLLVRGSMPERPAETAPRWFWLWTSADEAITPEIESFGNSAGTVTIRVAAEDVRSAIRPGEVLRWMSPYWQAYHVPMILRHDWQERNFTAVDAMHFDLGGLRGWNRADHAIPEGAVEIGLQAGGWDHEHCEICRAHIGAGGSPVGYVDPEDNWLCPSCYVQYAVPRDLSFLAE